MKTRALLVAALLAPLSSFAEPEPGARANVTLNLVRHDATLVSPESLSVKLVKYSYTSKDLLTELLDEGTLGFDQFSISGWKLVVVDRTPLFESEGSTLVFYAVKKDVTPVLIPSSRLGIDTDTTIGAEATAVKFKDEVTLVSHKNSFKSLVSFSGSSDDGEYSFELNGLASGSQSFAVRKLAYEGETFTYEYDLLSPISIKPVLGVHTDHAFEDTQTPIEGSISFSAFVPLDITDYADPDLEPDPEPVIE